jgi:hypothetical protein
MQKPTLDTIPEETQEEIDREIAQANSVQIEGLLDAVNDATKTSNDPKEITEKLSQDERTKPFQKTINKLKQSNIPGAMLVRYILKSISQIFSHDKNIKEKADKTLSTFYINKETDKEVSGKPPIPPKPEHLLRKETSQPINEQRIKIDPKIEHAEVEVLQKPQQAQIITSKQKPPIPPKPELLLHRDNLAKGKVANIASQFNKQESTTAHKVDPEKAKASQEKMAQIIQKSQDTYGQLNVAEIVHESLKGPEKQHKPEIKKDLTFADKIKAQAAKLNPGGGHGR